jgi:small subunit ribosomal protein S17
MDNCVVQVCSNKMDKTVVVIVEIRNWVNKYRTWHTKLRKYMAHDMENTCNIGDVVRIEQIPQKLSKRKAFSVIEVLQREKIVVEDRSSAEAQRMLSVDFTRRPSWAGLSPAVANEILRATSAYASYYEISDTAHALARRLPGWDTKIDVYRNIHNVSGVPEVGVGEAEV